MRTIKGASLAYSAVLCVLITLPLPGLTQQATPAAAPASTSIEEITVTGIRASVKAAQDIKKEAASVVEAITTEDLGKFTDANIADALQRVPGINIERTAGTFDAGYGITIRGLDAAFATSSLNGRDLLGIPDFFGGGGRQFDFQTVPPEILSGVTIYKTSTASLVEPGLAGQVNMQTLRPLEYHGRQNGNFFGSASAGVGRDSEARKNSPRYSGTVGGKFLDNTLGLYVAALYSNDFSNKDLLEHYAGRTNFTLDSGKVYNSTLVNLYGYDIWRANEERSKRSVATGAQWRPNSNFELNFDFSHNDSAITRRDQADYWYPAIGQPGFGKLPIPASALTFAGKDPGVVGWDATQMSGLQGYAISYLGALNIDYDNKANNGGLNGIWTSDDQRFKLSADYAYSRTDYTISWLHPYIDNGPTSASLETVYAGGVKPVIQATNPANGGDITAASSYNNITFSEDFQKRNRGNRDAERIDFEFKASDSMTLKTGLRYAKTDTKFVSMALGSTQYPTSVVGAFTADHNQLPFITWATPYLSLAGFCKANPVFCSLNNFGKGSMVGDFPTDPNGRPGDQLTLNTSETYQVIESNTAGYGQLDFRRSLFGLDTSGNVGLRAVKITELAKAFQGGCTKLGFDSGGCIAGTDRKKLVEDTNNFWTYLPSFNLSASPRKNINLRLAAGKSMTLATYQQLAPIGFADILLPVNGGTIVGNNVASSGNTKLKPTTAWNYDFTAEYYTDYGGAYIASVFYKDVKDLIITKTVLQQTVPGQGNVLFDVTTSENESTGHTSGLELGTNQPFAFLPSPWNGFGVQANYTYVSSRTTVSGKSTEFPGSSKNNINVNAYFEKFGWAARVAYNYRSQYLSAFSDGNRFTRAATRIDASVSKTFGSRFEVIVTGSNLTKSNRSDFDELAGFVTSYYQQPAVYSIGVRGTL